MALLEMVSPALVTIHQIKIEDSLFSIGLL